ncbi:MAG: HDIG domain-containing protein [Puniceicoccales bacterium]|jgi:putative nucleotidyltransferase with HDIG domain|nr:HDIG domain-containing protein [Puniceicoccales bacterium]
MGIRKRQSAALGVIPHGHDPIIIVGFRSAWLNKLASVLLFFVFAIGFGAISFLGNNWLRIQFLPGNISKIKIIAEIPFEYESKVRTERLYEQRKMQTSNVFVINERSYDEFIHMLKVLDEQIENFTYEHTLHETGREEIREFVEEFVILNVIQIVWQDIALLINSLSPIERAQVFQECISILREIAQDGVLSESISFIDQNQSMNYFGLKLKDGNKKNVRTLESALRYARTQLVSMDIDNEIVTILFNIIKQGIKPNLIYNAKESKTKSDMILKSIKPVRVKVKQWEVLLENNMEIDTETYEALAAYQKAIKLFHDTGYGFHRAFYPKIFLGTVALYAVTFFIRILLLSRRIKLRTILLCGLLVAAQLFFLRMFIYVGEHEIFEKNFTLICSLHFFAPILCASGIAMLIYGLVEGIAVSALVSVYYTLMLSKSIEFFVLLLISNLIFLHLLKNANFRIKIVRAGGISGLIVMLVIWGRDLLSLPLNKVTILQGYGAAVMGISSGITIVALLPIFERIFAAHSNVTLLELTDYNNPILKSLQFSAPGTYNHSLIVSNIAEQVAIQTNLNSVLCKTGALYHDIGKMLKSEYFVENQNNQINLHDRQTPYISTLIIKNHVKDGIELAKKHKLPPIIVDIIQQHHGTTVIQYFYEKAKKEILATVDTTNMSEEQIHTLVTNKVDVSTFRYDGPRPQTKENLIVMLADSVEAASRTMKRITHQAIESLVNNIFAIKLNDHQLDECPITFNEIRELKKIFTSVILSMMHSRISYNFAEESSANEPH